jgi:hypothetical protein
MMDVGNHAMPSAGVLGSPAGNSWVVGTSQFVFLLSKLFSTMIGYHLIHPQGTGALNNPHIHFFNCCSKLPCAY